MDTKGNIRELKPFESPRINEVPLDKKPNPKCKDCYGRGFVRYIIKNISEIVPCHCTKLNKIEENPEIEKIFRGAMEAEEI